MQEILAETGTEPTPESDISALRKAKANSPESKKRQTLAIDDSRFPTSAVNYAGQAVRTPEATEVLVRLVEEAAAMRDLPDNGIKVCYQDGWLRSEEDPVTNQIFWSFRYCYTPSE